MSLEKRAVQAYNDSEEERKAGLRADAQGHFDRYVRASCDECNVKKDYWGEYVEIKANGLTFRCQKRKIGKKEVGWELRLGRKTWRTWDWSEPIRGLKTLGEQLQYFQKGLHKSYCPGYR